MLDSLRLARLYVDLPGAADFFAEGDIKSLTETDSLSAKMALTAHLDRLDFLPAWIGAEIAQKSPCPIRCRFVPRSILKMKSRESTAFFRSFAR